MKRINVLLILVLLQTKVAQHLFLIKMVTLSPIQKTNALQFLVFSLLVGVQIKMQTALKMIKILVPAFLGKYVIMVVHMMKKGCEI